MKIYNKNDLREAYEAMNTFKNLLDKEKVNNKNVIFYMNSIKKDIRNFLKNECEKQHKLIKEDCDGYIELIQLPSFLNSKEEAIVYFESNEIIKRKNAIYDCTGQRFTTWYKIIERNEKLLCYHKVSFDV